MTPTGPDRQLRLPLRSSGAGDWVVSASNRTAVEALSAWPARDGAERVLALVGPAGCGKSRLGQAWAERVGAWPLHGVEAALIDPVELEGRAVLLDQADACDDETLFHLINLAQGRHAALLMVSRAPPAVWETALPDLRSRLDAVRTVRIEPPDDQVLAAMLRAAFAERSVTPGEDVVGWLVRRIDRSAEAAADAVARLDAEHRPVTRALARRVLGDAPELPLDM